MTTEQKFKKLLDIAIANGFNEYGWIGGTLTKVECYDDDINLKLMSCNLEFTYENGLSDYIPIEINNLVLMTNFFECLFKDALPCFYTGNFEMSIIHQYKYYWVLEVEKGTALEWLFKQFDL